MREIKYTITDELGIHARPAGQLVKQASAFKCDIKAASPAKSVDAKRIMGVMGLAKKRGDVLTTTSAGPDEAAAAAALEAFLKENL